MLFRIARHRNLEIPDALQTCHEIGCVHIAAWMRHIFGAGALSGIAAQRHDVANACIPVRLGDGVDFVFRRIDARQMRGRLQARLPDQAGDGCVRAFARRAAGAIRDRDEFRTQRCKARDRRPQRLFHLFRFRRKELEAGDDVARSKQFAFALVDLGHQRASCRVPAAAVSLDVFAGASPGRSASQIVTVRISS